MVKVYDNGFDFISENAHFLDQNKYMSVFFYIDGKMLPKADKSNYAIKVEGENPLLAIRVVPYNVLLYGNKELLGELLDYLNENDYEYNGFQCPEELGLELLNISNDFKELMGMDFMETKDYTEETSKEVVKADLSDLDELTVIMGDFFKECGLPDIPNRDKIKAAISKFRLIKVDGKIATMASISPNTDESLRVSAVFTRPEYRGRKYARMAVNAVKNEILEQGMIATLNVDKKNPISNHIYYSLGFRRVFSQGIYVKKGDK